MSFYDRPASSRDRLPTSLPRPSSNERYLSSYSDRNRASDQRRSTIDTLGPEFEPGRPARKPSRFDSFSPFASTAPTCGSGDQLVLNYPNHPNVPREYQHAKISATRTDRNGRLVETVKIQVDFFEGGRDFGWRIDGHKVDCACEHCAALKSRLDLRDRGGGRTSSFDRFGRGQRVMAERYGSSGGGYGEAAGSSYGDRDSHGRQREADRSSAYGLDPVARRYRENGY